MGEAAGSPAGAIIERCCWPETASAADMAAVEGRMVASIAIQEDAERGAVSGFSLSVDAESADQTKPCSKFVGEYVGSEG